VPIDFTFSDMAARSDIGPARWRKPFLSWLNGIEAGWSIPLLLIGFVAAWAAYLVIAYLLADVLETWTLGRAFDWGSLKHPPLMGWAATHSSNRARPSARRSSAVPGPIYGAVQ
jgi:hypothetical protein